MQPGTLLLRCLLAVGLLADGREIGAAELDRLSLIYVGDLDTPRAKEFEGFLRENVGRLKVAHRKGFDPGTAEDAEVVVLDWPQSEMARSEWTARSPLGERARWTKPTVLLGSAGLNLAVVWKVRGGSG